MYQQQQQQACDCPVVTRFHSLHFMLAVLQAFNRNFSSDFELHVMPSSLQDSLGGLPLGGDEEEEEDDDDEAADVQFNVTVTKVCQAKQGF